MFYLPIISFMQIYQWLALQAQTYFRVPSQFCWITYKRNIYLNDLLKNWLRIYSFYIYYILSMKVVICTKLLLITSNHHLFSSIAASASFLIHDNKSYVSKQALKKNSNLLVMFWAVTVGHIESQPFFYYKFQHIYWYVNNCN